MTVYSEFRKTAERFSARPFLHIPSQACAAYSAGPVNYTYADACAEVDRIAARYAGAGYGAGVRVALLLENRAEFFMHFLALNRLGASVVPVNAAFPHEEMRYVITHSDAALVVALPEHVRRADEALGRGSASPPVVANDALDALPDAPRADAPAQQESAAEAALLYTSGTTGRPKGCMLSNEYFLCMGHWYANLGGLCAMEPGHERLLTPLPLVHMNALACSTMGMIMTGGCLIQLDRFHAGTWWDTVRESGATCLHYLGVVPAILLNRPESPGEDFSGQVKFGFGAGCDPRHQARFEQRFGFPLVEGWAMTETGTEVCICAHEEPRLLGQRCIGRPTGSMEYRLVDEAGNDVAPGTPGELLVRAAGENPRRGFFSGYYKDPEATAAAWAGGWFHTGDVMRIDDAGRFYFVDRRKNIIRRSGENIAAVEVEGVLFQHPAVAACAVAPVPDEIRGEEVAACIILNGEHQADESTALEIFEHCSARLIYYKTPGYILFSDTLPMTASQKVQRGEVKKFAAARVAAGECTDLRERKRHRR